MRPLAFTSSVLLGIGLSLALACGSGPAGGPATLPPDNPQDDDALVGQTTVGLEVSPGAEDGGVHLVAVVTHGDGTQRRADLGAYQGLVAEVPAEDQELLHITILDDGTGHRIRLVRSEQGIEAMRQPIGDGESTDERLELIEVPEPSDVQPRDPAIELLEPNDNAG